MERSPFCIQHHEATTIMECHKNLTQDYKSWVVNAPNHAEVYLSDFCRKRHPFAIGNYTGCDKRPIYFNVWTSGLPFVILLGLIIAGNLYRKRRNNWRFSAFLVFLFTGWVICRRANREKNRELVPTTSSPTCVWMRTIMQ